MHQLFGVGRVPATTRSQLTQEGILVLDEGIRCSLSNPSLRTPTKTRRNYYRRLTGAVALTNVRFMAFENSRRCINIPFTDERIHKMRFAQEGENTLLVEFDPAMFKSDWAGVMVYRFHTPQARQLMTYLREHIA